MKWHKKIVSLILGLVLSLSVISIIVYSILPPPTQDRLLFFLIVLSGWTSGAGLAVSLWVFNSYEENIDQPLDDLTDKTGTLVEDLNEGFLEDMIDTLIRAEKRFANLPKEKQERVVRMVDKYSDAFLNRIEEMPDEKPDREVNEIED